MMCESVVVDLNKSAVLSWLSKSREVMWLEFVGELWFELIKIKVAVTFTHVFSFLVCLFSLFINCILSYLFFTSILSQFEGLKLLWLINNWLYADIKFCKKLAIFQNISHILCTNQSTIIIEMKIKKWFQLS